ncbi:MAG: Flp pilus assembly complex ATPase component TadA [Syntrophomonadaceae bacterium]|jgi:type IV pilus assembly protein PilB|nr:Flp pilus assembly complex ATPase component TadA [Syntrophomonadaceae bacterium]
MANNDLLGQIMVKIGTVTEKDVEAALMEQEISKEKIGRIFIRLGLITEDQLLKVLSDLWGIPLVQIEKAEPDANLFKMIPFSLMKTYKILPLSLNKQYLTVAMADPMNTKAIDDVQMATGFNVLPVLAGESDLQIMLGRYLTFHKDFPAEQDPAKSSNENGGGQEISANEEQLLINNPLIDMVDSILVKAVRAKVSDIHIEPLEKKLLIRFRIDGLLYPVFSLPLSANAAVISRLKILAGIDIAEKRLPQDGRLRMLIDKHQVDFRVATLPTYYGEKMVLRILDKNQAVSKLEQLGLTAANYEYMLQLAQKPHGLILATGPTGSGKTTTLYSLLGLIDAGRKNVITIEDPIEYTLHEINQVQTNAKAGLTFASGLRAILRQDPDVIMVGEIRDRETAELAVHTALTGHLVMSTLHTNSAAGSIARLVDMGVEGYLLGAALIGIISQRLVRKLCGHCREPYVLSANMCRKLGLPLDEEIVLYRAKGCQLCRQTGYQGRIAIHEIIVLGPLVRKLLEQGFFAEDRIAGEARLEGLVEIKNDGLLKARQGITSLEEIMQAVLLDYGNHAVI